MDGIKGAGALFTLQLGAGVAEDYSDELKRVRVTSEDRDDADLTFAEAAAGAVKDSMIGITAIQSTEVGSLWRLLWDNPGAEFSMVYGPHGNAVASATKPHFLATIKATGQPEIGGDAARKGPRFDFEYELEVDGVLTLDDGAP